MRTMRSGFTMIELMAVLTIGAVVMGISAGWIHQSFSTASLMQERLDHHQSLWRLSRRLRDDVHFGTKISMDGQNTLVIFGQDDNRSTFTIHPGAIKFLNNVDQRVGQDTFLLSDDSVAKWDTSEMPNWITLVIYRQPPFRRPELPTNNQTINLRDSPVDLHVRVMPKRWERLGIERVEIK